MTAPTPDAAPVAPVAPQQETFSRDYVESLRSEAAKYRTEKNGAVEAAKDALTKDYEGKLAEKDTVLADLQKQTAVTSLELLKLKTVLEAQVPVADVLEVVQLVQGDNEADVKASVERVKNLLAKGQPAPTPATDPTQGRGGPAIPLNGDPVLNLLKNAIAHKR